MSNTINNMPENGGWYESRDVNREPEGDVEPPVSNLVFEPSQVAYGQNPDEEHELPFDFSPDNILAAAASLQATAPKWMGRMGALFGITQHQIDIAAEKSFPELHDKR